jgi:uncharacterized membrane protein
MQQKTSRYGGWLRIYLISSHGQPTRDGPPALGLSGVKRSRWSCILRVSRRVMMADEKMFPITQSFVKVFLITQSFVKVFPITQSFVKVFPITQSFVKVFPITQSFVKVFPITQSFVKVFHSSSEYCIAH